MAASSRGWNPIMERWDWYKIKLLSFDHIPNTIRFVFDIYVASSEFYLGCDFSVGD